MNRKKRGNKNKTNQKREKNNLLVSIFFLFVAVCVCSDQKENISIWDNQNREEKRNNQFLCD